MKLDDTDLRILGVLRNDARLSLRDIGGQIGMSAPAVAARIRALEEAGVIEGYRTILGASHFALNLEVLLSIDCPYSGEAELVAFMEHSMHVSEMDRVSGDFAFVARASFHDTAELCGFLDELATRCERCRCSLVMRREIVRRSPIVLADAGRS